MPAGPLKSTVSGPRASSSIQGELTLVDFNPDLAVYRVVFRQGGEVLADSKDKFEDIQARYRDGRYDAGERALLVEGLLRRVIGEIEAPLPAPESDEDAKSDA